MSTPKRIAADYASFLTERPITGTLLPMRMKITVEQRLPELRELYAKNRTGRPEPDGLYTVPIKTLEQLSALSLLMSRLPH